MADIANGNKRFTWDIHWQCNYCCPYCWWHGKWQDIASQNYYPGLKRLIDTWERIYRLYGSAHIDISGGEPFLYPDFLEFISAVAHYHSLAINTNLSFEPASMIEKVKDNREKIRLNATFHPLFADFDIFINKAMMLQDNDFPIGIAYLAWPDQIKDISFYRKKFSENGFQLALLTFWGDYQGKKYPVSYTRQEKEIINPGLGSREGENFQVEPLIVQGKLCKAGNTYATIHPDGKTLRCGGGSWEKEDNYLGNLFAEDFALLSEPYPCKSKYCPCNEWAFLLVEK